MPHVTFIHGIANKPPKDQLIEDWKNSLADGGLDLEAAGVSTSMVYWADVMYPEPTVSDGAYESAEAGVGTRDFDDDDFQWVNDLPTDDQAFIASLRARLRFDEVSPGGDDYVPEAPPEPTENEKGGVRFEAVPLPWFIKRRVMKRLLKDVYYYLFNKEWTHASQGGSILVQNHIRDLFTQQLRQDADQNDGGAHVVVSHSMGSVISYDCLKHVNGCLPITGYMTVGSPLGISEVYDNFAGYDKDHSFPSVKLSGDWVNVYDSLDPIAFDSRLANDYKKSGVEVIKDQKVRNEGAWRHSSWKYFGQDASCNHLRDLLGV